MAVLELHATYLRKNGRNEFVVLPYEEFVLLQEKLADADDLLELRRAKSEEVDEPTITLDELKKQFGAT